MAKIEVMMELSSNSNKFRRKTYIEDLLSMYEEGIYDHSTLTIMLLECPELNVADFLRNNKSQETRSQEVEKFIENTSLIEFVRHKLVELYQDDSKLSANLTAPVTHPAKEPNARK
jgi:hypothetical protein